MVAPAGDKIDGNIMSAEGETPYPRLTLDQGPIAVKVRKGMTLEEVREIWRVQSEARTKEIMDKYYQQKAGRSGGREGLGIYSRFQSRAALEKERLAERLLKSAGLPTDEGTIRRVMRR